MTPTPEVAHQEPCTWIKFFAESIPIVVIFIVVAFSWLVEHHNAHHSSQMPFQLGATIPLGWAVM